MKIGFVGERGDYGESAAAVLFGGEDIHTVACRGYPALFEALAGGRIEYGVVRYETSYVGLNPALLDHMRTASVYMTRECVLPEIYHLAGTQAAKLSGIRRIYAHPNAFSACQNFLERMPGVDLIVTFDAAATALQLARRKDAAEATVCSDFAAKIHGFSIIQRGIQSDAEAESRFIALGRHLETPPANATEIHTAILFVLRNEPGQLHRVLGILKDRGINVHVLGSRPTHVNRWEYAIGLELEGRAQDEGLQQAMTELKNATVYLQLLGSYYRVETQKSGRFSPTA